MASITLTMASLLMSCLQAASHSLINGGFSLELIPPHSPKSPLFNYFTKQIPSTNGSHIVTPPISQPRPSWFVVKVGLGTFDDARSPSASYRSYYLVMDTGSSLTWTQCEDCKLPGNHCYQQKEPVLPNKKSKSYHPLPCDKHRPCEPKECTGGHCPYSLKYEDGASSSGILATETFSFPSSSATRTEAVQGVVFGCGTKNKDEANESAQYEIAGVFGLGQGDRSFVNQIQKQSMGNFSYCLTNNMHTPMHLRFGADIKPPRDLRTIKFFQNKRYDDEAYYVTLVDLGINGKPLGLNPREFQVGANGKGGCIVDSGTSYSYVVKKAYDALEKKLTEYFARLPEFSRYRKRKRGEEGNLLCYIRKKVQGFKNIPGVNWYFEGGVRMDVTGMGKPRSAGNYKGKGKGRCSVC